MLESKPIQSIEATMPSEKLQSEAREKQEILGVVSGLALGLAFSGAIIKFTEEKDKKYIAPTLFISALALVIGVQIYKHKK